MFSSTETSAHPATATSSAAQMDTPAWLTA